MNSLNKTRKFLTTGLAVGVLSLTLFGGMVSAEGNGLNGVGSTQTPPAQTAPAQTAPATTTVTQTPVVTPEASPADAMKALNEGLSVKTEDAQKANQIMSPIITMVNLGFAVILSIATLGMFLITALDLLYIAVPPVRNMLYPGGDAQPQGGGGMGMGGGGFGGGGFGGGGYGGGMGGGYGGGMGGGMMGGQQQAQPSTLGRFISDEAVAAVAVQQPQGGGMGGGMMGGMMGGQQQAPAPAKSVILSYFKKRMFFLVAFGVCAVLLSTTIFTDLGIKLGSWIMARLMGLETNFPE